MKQNALVKEAKKSGSLFLDTVLMMIPAVAGGTIGSGLGRQSLWVGGGLLTAAQRYQWPDWVKLAAITMAVNGVSTTKPVTDAAIEASGAGEQLGMLPFIPDNFMERGEQYLRNLLMKTYLDKVPVVNKFVGLAGVEGNTFMPSAAADIYLNPAARNELNRLMAQRTAGTMAGIDSEAFDQLSGLDQSHFDSAMTMPSRDELLRRRAA